MQLSAKRQSRIEAVAFDLDGLMFNTEELFEIVDHELLGRRGLAPDPDLIRKITGRPAQVAIPMLIEWYGLKDTVRQIQAEIDEIFRGLLDDKLLPMPGLIGLLNSLSSHQIPKAITTSSRRWFLEKLLKISGVESRFDFYLTAESVTDGKPHPEIYLTAAKQFGVAPANLMVLEDSEIGCQAAVAAGVFAVAVPSHHSIHHDFPPSAMTCESLSDPRILDALGIRST